MRMQNLTPTQIVAELDKYVVGQKEAKRSVAVALRNRYRRSRLSEELRNEVTPKNILMIGPTGVGKTEIARRIAKLTGAPFIKVEATKYTEVGYVGRDVDSMVRDLVETSVRMVKIERLQEASVRVDDLVNERLLEALVPNPNINRFRNPLDVLYYGNPDKNARVPDEVVRQREQLRPDLLAGRLESRVVEIEMDGPPAPALEMIPGMVAENLGNLQDMLESFAQRRKKHRKLKVSEARKLLAQEEAQKLIDMDDVVREAIRRAEESGIIFIDEFDKIAVQSGGSGGFVSREGVQRDILPIVEGSTVITKHGPVKTDYMLFIAAGAFHMAKPSDLIPELQGRFPIRVELDSLTADDFERILTEPEHALLTQYTALLETEGIEVRFTPDAVRTLAEFATEVNANTENIGARRLHTLVERVLGDLLFAAPDIGETEVVITPEYVREKLGRIAQNRDLSQYIL
ncbi:ATP-dependent protease ATPase subunit HslU [Sulfoacidibacillus thermotolerans]|uniref:ATP-dependent protease ATPase subunit HslU n=1 Tax=Sulfoacidibacillus thermotolerans TaxID=1765684 RepID=A0A2U3DA72_SULT2|nr:ATP-dependent protease ATPase subunit HslU [Sulfoacidibacillus thermotolerans]PWI58180.1 HslU--HslV peptidase ATPase subunit [Sulfoacidibacillus thermotolerans]